ncbi:hypothetical protein H072_4795 [Dactylellina haptotyla CBS 200.50]|uniref:Autophagy-related protein 27 n=1 Tax=Dactylellina haptotyla (strain CBS 200.50) TaxID=1284197 RepID=S8BP26_DACHA|nr:hypothetical protein H072_4795 [Dactylellina haptotyla CBS 200.50]
MRTQTSLSLLSTLLLLPASILADSAGFTGSVESDGIKFDFKELKQHSVVVEYKEPAPPHKTTFIVNPLGQIEWDKDVDKDDRCPDGTQVCMVTRAWHNDKPDEHTSKVVTGAKIAEDFKPEYSVKRDDDDDKKVLGLTVTLHGPEDGEKHKKQVTIINFLCDKMIGTEEPDKEGKGDNALKFVSYEDDATLTLEWKTKFACEKADAELPGESNASWGIFTWFILIAFMAVAAYLIFGSWLNYNKYGARGWDLLPHNDTLRDLPYLVKDFLRRAVNTFQGSGGRGGYSAI